MAALLAAVWPVWRWTTLRLADGSDGSWELLAAITAIAVLLRDRGSRTASDAPPRSTDGVIATLPPPLANAVVSPAGPSSGQERGSTAAGQQDEIVPTAVSLSLPISLLVLYVASYAFVSPLVRAVFATAAMGTLLSSLWYRRRIELPVIGLLLISLPVMASLNFYLGYPLRVIAGEFTELLLQSNGIAATREGALLIWNGKSIAIDAPCSGVRMLWTGAYLCLSLAALMRLNTIRTIALGAATLVVVIAANALRATSLFYVEAQLITAPDFVHDAVGLVTFLFAAAAVFFMARQLADTFQPTGSSPAADQFRPIQLRVLLITCFAAALTPVAVPAPATVDVTGFPDWPTEFEGRSLRPLPLTQNERRFAEDFPGRIGRFTDGRREIILRWVSTPHRKLHPAADCFRGSGYTITPLPIVTTVDSTWSSFSAQRAEQRLIVRETIVDTQGGRWSDVSSWYWAAVRNDTQRPWLAITIAATAD